MTTLNLVVGADVDDAYSYGGSQVEDKSFVYWNYSGATAVLGASRFTNVTIGQGDTIDAATMQLYLNDVTKDDIDFDIYADDVDNSEVIEGGTPVHSRTLTSASVRWTALNMGIGWETSPSITSVIQEIISRGGWASDNALSIIGNDPQSVRIFQSRDYSSDASEAAKLDIDYTAVAAAPDFGWFQQSALVPHPPLPVSEGNVAASLEPIIVVVSNFGWFLQSLDSVHPLLLILEGSITGSLGPIEPPSVGPALHVENVTDVVRIPGRMVGY